VFSWTELKQLCLYLYSAKHHFSGETASEYNNTTSDEDSNMELHSHCKGFTECLGSGSSCWFMQRPCVQCLRLPASLTALNISHPLYATMNLANAKYALNCSLIQLRPAHLPFIKYDLTLFSPNETAHTITLLSCILKVFGSDLVRNTYYPDWGSSYIKLDHDHFLSYPFQLIFLHYPTIRSYIKKQNGELLFSSFLAFQVTTVDISYLLRLADIPYQS
jgi:hypothetical protein